MPQETPWFKGIDDPLAKWFLKFSKDKYNDLEFRLGPLDLALTEGILEKNKGASPPQHTKILALDCEMVQVGVLPDEQDPASKRIQTIPGLPPPPPSYQTKVALARVSIVDFDGKVVYDTFCKPKEVVIDFKTQYSGVTAEDIADAPSVKKVQKQVAKIVEDAIIIGQSLDNDFSVLGLTIPPESVRDTAAYFKRFHPRGKFIGLKDLAKLNLGLDIQQGSHDSIIDSRVSMLLYRQLRGIWEKTMPIYESVETDSCFPVPLTFPAAFREAISMLAAVDPNQPLPPLSKCISEITLRNSFKPDGVPLPSPALSKQTPGFNILSLPPALPSAPYTISLPPSLPTSLTLPKSLSPVPSISVPMVVKTKKELHVASTSNSQELPKQVKASSDMILRTFYSFLPREQKLMKFNGFPLWVVPEGSNVGTESQMLLADVKRNLGKLSEAASAKDSAPEKVKVDTSLPGFRKRQAMAAAAAAASATTVDTLSKTDKGSSEAESNLSKSKSNKRKASDDILPPKDNSDSDSESNDSDSDSESDSDAESRGVPSPKKKKAKLDVSEAILKKTTKKTDKDRTAAPLNGKNSSKTVLNASQKAASDSDSDSDDESPPAKRKRTAVEDTEESSGRSKVDKKGQKSTVVQKEKASKRVEAESSESEEEDVSPPKKKKGKVEKESTLDKLAKKGKEVGKEVGKGKKIKLKELAEVDGIDEDRSAQKRTKDVKAKKVPKPHSEDESAPAVKKAAPEKKMTKKKAKIEASKAAKTSDEGSSSEDDVVVPKQAKAKKSAMDTTKPKQKVKSKPTQADSSSDPDSEPETKPIVKKIKATAKPSKPVVDSSSDSDSDSGSDSDAEVAKTKKSSAKASTVKPTKPVASDSDSDSDSSDSDAKAAAKVKKTKKAKESKNKGKK
ncbi:3'-5' exonuclease [Phlyctochytrium planicorne]|nr:3'-5' exonuclease [Phlyctochytrium planicorne]